MLFEPQLSRKPNLYPWTQEFIDKMWAGFWTPNEFDFKSDYHQFKTVLPENHKRMVVKTLTAIGQIEIAVKKFWAQLGDNLPHPSMSDLGFVMANSEVIHNQAYEKLLDKLNLSKAFEENLKEPIFANRVKYLKKYLEKTYNDDKKQYIYAIILFTLFVENVSLFSQFYVILWLNRYNNVLKDTAQQVQYTRNEEQIHALIGIKIINTLREEYPELFDNDLEYRICEEAIEALEAERKIIRWILKDVDEPGLNEDVLVAFVSNRVNDSFKAIGLKPIFDLRDKEELLEQTEWFKEELFGNNMVDFFFKKPVDYAKKNKVITENELF